MASRRNEMEVLEGVIDANGMTAVLDMLEEICVAKAEHVRTNWQDENRAKSWAAMARKFGLARLFASERAL